MALLCINSAILSIESDVALAFRVVYTRKIEDVPEAGTGR
jgi:hypothetical protein